MKILPNIPGVIKLIYCLKYFNERKKPIEEARVRGDYEEERKYIKEAENIWGPMVLKYFGSTLTIHGEENIPEEGPIVIVANHQGYCDIPALFATFKNMAIAFVAKKELRSLPIYGVWIERIRSVFMDREDSREALKTIKAGIDNLNNGFSMVIFPEGTRSKGGEPGEFMKGPLKLATKPGVPIVPVSIEGTYKMFEEKGTFSPADIHVMVHEQIPTAGISRQEEKELNDRVEKIIKDGVKKLQGEEI